MEVAIEGQRYTDACPSNEVQMEQSRAEQSKENQCCPQPPRSAAGDFRSFHRDLPLPHCTAQDLFRAAHSRCIGARLVLDILNICVQNVDRESQRERRLLDSDRFAILNRLCFMLWLYGPHHASAADHD